MCVCVGVLVCVYDASVRRTRRRDENALFFACTRWGNSVVKMYAACCGDGDCGGKYMRLNSSSNVFLEIA